MKTYEKPMVEIENLFSEETVAAEILVSVVREDNVWGNLFSTQD